MTDNNKAGIAGKIAKAPEHIESLYGRRDLYKAYVDVSRRSGIADSVIIVFPERAIDKEGHEEELNFLQPRDLLTRGKDIVFIGSVQTMRNAASGQIELFIYCDYIRAGYAVPQNEVFFTGTVERDVVTRVTPKGRRITDLLVRIPSEFEASFYCLAPVIAWNDTAIEAAQLKKGDIIEIGGRLQSREYTKRYEDGREEVRTATEVSTFIINKK